MEIASILRLLGRHKWWIVPGVLLAVLAALVPLYHVSPSGLESRRTMGGVASARVLLVARDAPAFDLRSSVAETLPTRSALLADLLTTDSVQEQIASRAGIAPKDLAVLGPAMGAPEVPVPIAVMATEAAARPREPYLVRVTSAGGRVPIITILGNAGDELAAAKVVEATLDSLDEVIASEVGGQRGVEVSRLGLVTSKTVVDEPPVVLAPVAFVFVLLGWCGAIAVLTGVHRQLRARRAAGAQAAPAGV